MHFYTRQSLPDGVPDILHPNLAKVDLDLLNLDIGKYYKAGLFPEQVYSCWKGFLENFPESYGQVPEITPQWPVGTTLKSTTISEAISEVVLPTTIIQLHEAEVTPMEPVRTKLYDFVILVCIRTDL